MYGIGQTSPRRRGLVVIVGVFILSLVLVGLFYGFYALVLNQNSATPTPTLTREPTTTTLAIASPEEPTPTHSNTAAAVPTSSTATATVRATRTIVASDTPEPEPTATLRPPPTVITVGVRARVSISEGLALNLRDQPTLSGSTVITRMVGGAEVDVIDGPEDGGDLRWWNVSDGNGRVGWVVQSFGGDTYLVLVGWTDQFPPLSIPAPADTPAPTDAPTVTAPAATPVFTPTATPELAATAVLTPTATSEGGSPSPVVGGRARVTTRFQFINLRSAAGLSAEAIGQLDDGTIVTIIEGPEEADDFRWWKVDDDQGNVGWAAERVGDEVLLVPIP